MVSCLASRLNPLIPQPEKDIHMKKFMVVLAFVAMLSFSAPANATTGATGGKTGGPAGGSSTIGNSDIVTLIVSELISLLG